MKTRRQIFGQHYLNDDKVIGNILSHVRDAIGSQPSIKAILEVGPGELALTRGLHDLAADSKLPLFIVERDERLKDHVVTTYPDLNERFFLMDAATENFGTLLKDIATQSRGKILFVSNLPYSAGSQILAQLCAQSEHMASAVVMVQKEVADRMLALTSAGNRKEAGAFSYLIHAKFETTHLADVSPSAFTPPPKVWSTVVKLISRPHTAIKSGFDFGAFEVFVKKLFSSRRKMIRKTLSEIPVDQWQTLGLSGQERPEELSFEQTVSLFHKTC